MRRKLISLLLAAATLSSMTFTTAFASGDSTENLTELVQLGIINDMSDVEFKPGNTVVKKVFYTALYNIMTDEEETDAKIISHLKRYNINVDDFTFRDNITRKEALSATVSMLGYTYRVLDGSELESVATQLGVRKYLTGDILGDMTLGEMVNLLNGAILADMVTLKLDASPAGYSYEKVPDVTPLMYYKDIHFVKGTVNKNSYASVVDDTPSIKGYVQIDDEAMLIGTTNAGDYLGMPVEAYVQYDKDGEGTIRCIAPNEKYVTVTKLDSDDIINVDSSIKNIEYEIGNKTKTSQISSTVKVIFNGQNYGDYTREDLMPEIGSVELIDSDKNKIIDVINVKSYKTMLVNYASSYSLTVVNKYSDPAAVKLDANEREVIIEKNGAAAEFSVIKPNDVLLVAESNNADGVVHVIISDKQETVLIGGFTTDNEVKVGDKLYKLSPAYVKECEKEGSEFILPGIGKNYSVYLDAFGNISYAVNHDGKIYVYATRLWQDDTDECYYMKALTTESAWETYKWSDKMAFTHEGETVRDNEYAFSKLRAKNLETQETKLVPQLLRVEFNSDGELKSIETANDVKVANENQFTKYKMDRTRIYQTDNKTFCCDVYGTNTTKVFIVPTDKTNEDEYRVTTMGYFKLDYWYQVEAYDMDKFRTSELIVYETDAKSVGTGLYVVKKLYETFVDGEVRQAAVCLSGNSEVELVTTADYKFPEGLKVGDVIQIATNSKGEITLSSVYKSISGNIDKVYPSLSNPVEMYRAGAFASGYITDIDGDKGMLLVDCGISYPASFMKMSSTQIYLYDGDENERVRAISLSDIEPGDGALIFIDWAKPTLIYVVRNFK